jgi:hypothetical protein
MDIRIIALTGLLWTAGVGAQGYFDFDDIPGVGERPSVRIDLNKQMLGFVTAAAGASGEPNAAEILAGIDLVRVRVYEELEDPEEVIGFIDDSSSRLEQDGWQPAVSIQDGEDRVRIYMQFVDDRVAGMTVMVADGSEAVFINIVGTIDPVMLGQLSRQIGINGVIDGIGGILVPPTGQAVPRTGD